MQGKNEIAFAKQLNHFEAAMSNDLNQRSSDVAKKWEFDFSMDQPQMGKSMSWEPVKMTATMRTRAQIPNAKPKMNIAHLINNKNNSDGSAQVFFSSAAPRTSIFGSSVNTDSTVGDSIFNGSNVNDSIGKSSIGDFSIKMSTGGWQRTSISQKIQLQRKQSICNGRLSQAFIPRESDESINNRGSCIDSEEGRINDFQPAVNAGRGLHDVKVEEFKTSVVELSHGKNCESPNSGNGSTR